MSISLNRALLKRALYAWMVFTFPFVMIFKALGGDSAPSYLKDIPSTVLFVLMCAVIAFVVSLIFGSIKISFKTKNGS